MSRIFTDTEGNVIPDIEYRISHSGLIRALIASGVLTGDQIAEATDGRILEAAPDPSDDFAAIRNKAPADKKGKPAKE